MAVSDVRSWRDTSRRHPSDKVDKEIDRLSNEKQRKREKPVPKDKY
jgi:hypothetical protein